MFFFHGIVTLDLKTKSKENFPCLLRLLRKDSQLVDALSFPRMGIGLDGIAH